MLNIKPFEIKNGVKMTLLDESNQEKLLSNNSYFRYVLSSGLAFTQYLQCSDITDLLKQYGYKAYNYKTYWEDKGIPFERGLMLFLLSKIEPFSGTVGKVGDTYVREEEWVVEMYQKNFIQMAFSVIKQR